MLKASVSSNLTASAIDESRLVGGLCSINSINHEISIQDQNRIGNSVNCYPRYGGWYGNGTFEQRYNVTPSFDVALNAVLVRFHLQCGYIEQAQNAFIRFGAGVLRDIDFHREANGRTFEEWVNSPEYLSSQWIGRTVPTDYRSIFIASSQ